MRPEFSRIPTSLTTTQEVPDNIMMMMMICRTIQYLPILQQFPPPGSCSNDESCVVDEYLVTSINISLSLDCDPLVLDVDGVFSIGRARVIDQAEHREQSSSLLVTKHDGVGLQDSDGPHDVLLGEVEITSLKKKVHNILLVTVPHVCFLLSLLLVIHQKYQSSEPLRMCVLLHQQSQWCDALVDRRFLVLDKY